MRKEIGMQAITVTFVAGAFPHCMEAQAVVEDLLCAGFRVDQIAVIPQKERRESRLSGETLSALFGFGFPDAADYQEALDADKFLVVVEAEEKFTVAKEILERRSSYAYCVENNPSKKHRHLAGWRFDFDPGRN
jgi:hypothetical protein